MLDPIEVRALRGNLNRSAGLVLDPAVRSAGGNGHPPDPPLGIKHGSLWLEDRITELALAISERAVSGDAAKAEGRALLWQMASEMLRVLEWRGQSPSVAESYRERRAAPTPPGEQAITQVNLRRRGYGTR